MWIVKFRCEKGHEQTIVMPDEIGERGARVFATVTAGGRLSELVPGAVDSPPAECSWHEAKDRCVVRGATCGAPVTWDVSHAESV
jgi:hypothetical protein